MAKVKKRGKSYQIDYFDISGKRVRKSFKTRAEADVAIAEAMVNKGKGLSNIIDKKYTFTKACEYFLCKYAKKHCKESTYNEYKRIIENDIMPFFGEIKLNNLTKERVEDFVDELLENRELSKCSINKYVTLIGAIIQKQIENEKIFKNVARSVKKFSFENKKGRALTIEEINILLETCKEVKPDFYPMLYTVLNTGMRRGEAIALMWKNVDFKNNRIYVEHSEYRGKLTTPKTKASYRYINMCPRLKKVLVELKLKSSNSEFVFPNANGGLLDGHNVSKRLFKKVVKLAKIGKIKFHDLRHTYATHMTTIYGNIHYVQSQLGHSSAKMTLDIYGHLLPDVANNVMDIMEKEYAIS